MNLQQQINNLSEKVGKKIAFADQELNTEKNKRVDQFAQQKSDLDYIAIITGIDLEV